MIKTVDHIGIAVHSIEAAIPFYTDILQLSFIGFEEVSTQQVKVALLSAGNTKIELLEPMSDESTIAKFLKKRGEGVHHIGFTVDHLEGKLNKLKKQGVPLIDEIPRIGAAYTKIAFLHPSVANHVLVELCEKQRGDV